MSGANWQGGLVWGDASGGGGGEGGTSDHRQLTNRDAANQHPLAAITGLSDALDGKVSKTGDTMSGDLIAPKFIGQLYTPGNNAATGTITPAFVYSHTPSSTTGSLGIKIPTVANTYMLWLEIGIYCYGANQTVGKVWAGGYFPSAGLTVGQRTAISLNANLVSKVRFAWDGTNYWLLFNDASRTWAQVTVAVTVMRSWAVNNLDKAGWELRFFDAAAESALTINPDISLNNGLIPASGYAPAARGYLNGSTGAFTQKFGDIAVTKTDVGVYKLSSASNTVFQPQMSMHGGTPKFASYTVDGPGSYTLRTWGLDGNLTDANGDIFVWI